MRALPGFLLLTRLSRHWAGILGAGLLLCFSLGVQAQTNLLVNDNYSFETGDFTDWTTVTAGEASGGSRGDVVYPAQTFGNCSGPIPPSASDGSQIAILEANCLRSGVAILYSTSIALPTNNTLSAVVTAGASFYFNSSGGSGFYRVDVIDPTTATTSGTLTGDETSGKAYNDSDYTAGVIASLFSAVYSGSTTSTGFTDTTPVDLSAYAGQTVQIRAFANAYSSGGPFFLNLNVQGYLDNVRILATPNGPVITTTGGSTAFTAGDNVASTPVIIDSGIIVSDTFVGVTTLTSATVSVTDNFQSGEDVLAFTNPMDESMGDIANAGYVLDYPSAGILTLTSAGASTIAQWQNALASVTYTDTAITPDTAPRTISFVATDTVSNVSSAATKIVTLTDTDQTPIVITSGDTTGWTESNSLVVMSIPVVIDSGVTVSDLDNTTLASGTVSITGSFQSGEDVLAFTNDGITMGNISAVYTSGTGVLALSSSGAAATLAQWQAALRAVTYNDTSQPPTGASRTISFVVNDGTESSTAAAKSVSLTTVNHPPIFTLGSSPSWPAATSGLETAANFATVTSFGQTGESGQAVMAWHVTDMTDTEGVISGGSSGILIQNDGTLVYSLSGQSGTATISVTLQDNGGTLNGGNDTSAAQTFTITVGNGWDLSISMDDNTNGKNFFDGGDLADYTITVQNIGSSDAHGATVQDTLPSNLLGASWTCEAITTATCTASGTGDISDTVSIPKNSAVIYHLTATVQADPEDPVSNTAMVATAAGETDIDLSNNTTTIMDTVGVFTDGFESFGKSLIRDMTITASKAQTQVVTLDASHEILKPQPLLIARIHDSASTRMAEVHLRQDQGQTEVRLSWRGDDGLWQPGAWHVLTNPSELALAWSTEAGSQHDWPLAEVEITQGNTTISRVGIDP